MGTALAGLEPEDIEAHLVLAAAAEGDALAEQIVVRLGDRLARICSLVAGLLDLNGIIVTGPLAPALGGVVESAREALSNYLYAPWLEIAVSELGADAVRLGAVHFAVDRVRQRALQGAPADPRQRS